MIRRKDTRYRLQYKGLKKAIALPRKGKTRQLPESGMVLISDHHTILRALNLESRLFHTLDGSPAGIEGLESNLATR